VIIHKPGLRTCFGLKGHLPPCLIKDRQRPRPVTQGSDHKIRIIQQRKRGLVIQAETMQLQARLRRPSANTALA